MQMSPILAECNNNRLTLQWAGCPYLWFQAFLRTGFSLFCRENNIQACVKSQQKATLKLYN